MRQRVQYLSGWEDHLGRRRKEIFCARSLLLPTSWYKHRRQRAFAEKCRFNPGTMGQNSSAVLVVFCYTNPWRQSLILKALIKFYIKNILQSGRIMIGTFVFRVFFQYNGFWYSFNLSHIECFCEMVHDIAITQKMEIVEQIAKESKPHRTRK